MTTSSPPIPPVQQEFCVLLRHFASVQARCSQHIFSQHTRIRQLEQERMRLRAALVLRDTRLHWMEEDMRQLQAMVPGLPRRKALLQRIDTLLQRVQELMREKLQWQQALSRPAATHASRAGTIPAPAPALAELDAAALAQSDHGALEAHLSEADLVICQTGCVSHNDYWRLHNHCKRTGKQCVLIEQPDALRIVRIQAIAGNTNSAAANARIPPEAERELSLIPGAMD